MESRLNYLYLLEDFMDSNDTVFAYDKRKNPSSKIDSMYLLQNIIQMTTVYFFIDKSNYNDTLIGRTFFPKGNIDLSKNQTKFTLLYKEKVDLVTKKAIIQHDKLSPLKVTD